VEVSREELLRKLAKIDFTEKETRELKQAMDAASEVWAMPVGGITLVAE